MGVFDVPPTRLIQGIAVDLKEKFGIEKPLFADYVKTGSNRERSPLNEDWYFIRMASVLYRVFKEGPLGTGSLRTYYGGKKNKGVKPHRFKKASGKILRLCLQELERIGLVKKEKKGRVIAGKGHSYLVKKAVEIQKKLKDEEKVLAEKKAEKELKLREIEKRKGKDVSIQSSSKQKFKKKTKETMSKKERRKERKKSKKKK